MSKKHPKKQLSPHDPRITVDGGLAHPDAPAGGGGPGRFRQPTTIGSGASMPSGLPHPRSPSARYVADNGGLPTADVDLNSDVADAARKLEGQKAIGRGECYDLADKILKGIGAKSAGDYDRITGRKDQDYQWGDKIEDLTDIKPGDILQFRDHVTTISFRGRKYQKTYGDGTVENGTDEADEIHTRGPQHTSIVLEVLGGGKLTVLEQHVVDPVTRKQSDKIRRNRLYLNNTKETLPAGRSAGSDKKGHYTMAVGAVDSTITVTGEVWLYRPVKKSAK